MPVVLLLDDDSAVRKQLYWALCDDFDVLEAGDPARARTLLSEQPVDVALIDLRLPPDPHSSRAGLEFVRHLREHHPATLPIVMTGDDDTRTALDAVRAGAADFFVKPVDLAVLQVVLGRALKVQSLERENERLRQAASEAPTSDGMLGQSPAMREVASLIERMAPTDATVLVTGESGTGKELVARALHRASRRTAGPFIAVNCAAIAPTLMESDLFGHEKGAFTGALAQRRGKFELAHGGTLFLDEIAELTAEAQAKLLRALQERTVERLGSERSRTVDVRVVAATHQDLAGRVADGRFRQDLFYRLQVLPLALPPLRARTGDVAMLAEHFLTSARRRLGRGPTTFSPAALDLLGRHPWPGNVRELENLCERLAILCPMPIVRPDDLPLEIRGDAPLTAERDPISATHLLPLDVSLAEGLRLARRALVQHALDRSGNRSAAAEQLGINRTYLYELLKELESGSPTGAAA